VAARAASPPEAGRARPAGGPRRFGQDARASSGQNAVDPAPAMATSRNRSPRPADAGPAASAADAGPAASAADARRAPGELDALYSAAPLGLAAFDLELRYLRINDRLAEINGWPATAHLGRTVAEMCPTSRGRSATCCGG
jgi:PAS domain-containing protein